MNHGVLLHGERFTLLQHRSQQENALSRNVPRAPRVAKSTTNINFLCTEKVVCGESGWEGGGRRWRGEWGWRGGGGEGGEGTFCFSY